MTIVEEYLQEEDIAILNTERDLRISVRISMIFRKCS